MIDLVGHRFGRLMVVAPDSVRNYKQMWRCQCDCGNFIRAATGQLRSGNSKSCGCLKQNLQTKHGQYRTRTYRIWQAMLNRCRQTQYEKYYGHLSVCERWKEFEHFLADMGHAPDTLTLDRIDNSKGYEPANCRWATPTIQARNTRRRKEYEFDGKHMSLIEWAEFLGVKHELLRGRIRRGWEFKDAIATNA